MDALATPEGEELRRQLKVARGTLLRVAYADARAADVTTGRGVATAHDTVAAALGMCRRTVQRSRDLIARLGFAVTIEEGRYLTTGEREAARQVHGGQQIRAASVRALTMPKPAPVENVHLPLPRRGLSTSPVLKVSNKRADARVAASRLQQGSKKRSRRLPRQMRPVAVQQLAGKLVAVLPWLARDTHIGRVCDLLTRAGIDPARWTAPGLKAEVDRFLRSAGVQVVDPSRQKDPVAYFGWMLKMAIDPAAETSYERQLREQAEAVERRRQWVIERDAERARAATLTDEEFYRIKAESDAQIAAQRGGETSLR